MALPDSFVEEVRRTADIVRYISEHVALRRMGTSWKGLCPFHQEKTPSFNVRAEPPVFHCFGCGEGGDVFKFVMLRERVSFPEAVTVVARRFGIPVPETRGFDAAPERKDREEILALLEAAADHFARNLWLAPGARAREYLLGRGFKRETLERIRAGAVPDSWSDLLDALRRRFSPQLLLKAGLILERQDGSGHYDRFRNRAVFPILNEGGKVVAFGARSLDGSEPKYLNSPETPVYQKSRTLYGLSWAREAIRETGRVVLMEGYLDVARAIEHGIGEAVATCGTALTPAHGRLLHRFTGRVVLNFDQDEAGRKAVLKSLETLVEEGLELRVIALPEGHDPDSFLREQGAEAYRTQLADAPHYVEWLIRRAAAENDTRTPPGKAAYLGALLPALSRIDSAVERAAWLPRVVEAGGLDRSAAEQELRRALSLKGGSAPAAPAPAAGPVAARRLLPAEKWLLALLARGAEGAGEALEDLQETDMDGLRTAAVLRAARALHGAGSRLTLGSLEEALTEEDDRRLLREVAVEGTPVEHATPLGCVIELRRKVLAEKLRRIQGELDAKKARGEQDLRLSQEKIVTARELQGLQPVD